MRLTPVAAIPESQTWTLREPHRSAIERGMEWAAANPPEETDLDELATRSGHQPQATPSPGLSK